MQSVTRHWDPTLSDGNLRPSRQAGLTSLAAGASVTGMLDRDLAVSSNPDNLTHVLQDDLHNVYQGSDVGQGIQPTTSRRLAAVGIASGH